MAIEIVNFPIKNGWIFHSFLLTFVYQRVDRFPLGTQFDLDRKDRGIITENFPTFQGESLCNLSSYYYVYILMYTFKRLSKKKTHFKKVTFEHRYT